MYIKYIGIFLNTQTCKYTPRSPQAKVPIQPSCLNTFFITKSSNNILRLVFLPTLLLLLLPQLLLPLLLLKELLLLQLLKLLTCRCWCFSTLAAAAAAAVVVVPALVSCGVMLGVDCCLNRVGAPNHPGPACKQRAPRLQSLRRGP